MAKVKYIRGILRTVSSQRLQYKPYGYELSFMQTFQDVGVKAVAVELELPAETVIEEGDGYVVLGLEGLNAILEVTADSLDKLNEKHMDKIIKGGK